MGIQNFLVYLVLIILITSHFCTSLKSHVISSKFIDNLLVANSIKYAESYNRNDRPTPTTDLPMENKCSKDILYFLKHLNSTWALHMFDADGKIPSGILSGNMLWMGNYHECLASHPPTHENSSPRNFHGQYCVATWKITLPKTIYEQQLSLRTGLCLPDSCDASNISKNFKHLLKLIDGISFLKQYEEILMLDDLSCRSPVNELNLPALLFLSILGCFVGMSIISSVLSGIDYFKKRKHNKIILNTIPDEPLDIFDRDLLPEHEQSEFINSNDTTVSSKHLESYPKRILKCFCLFTNASKILSTETCDHSLPCLHGIRFLSMSWVILGHTYVHNVKTYENYVDALLDVDNLPFQIIMQGTFSVDTFFLIGGFLLARVYLKEADKKEGHVNWFGLCLHRYVRLTPVYAVMLGCATLLFKYMDSGPFWEETSAISACKTYWFWNLLYVNNFQSMNTMCLTWTWYLANDMQFFLICSLVLYVLWRWPKLGLNLFCVIIIGSWVITWCISNTYSVSPLFSSIPDASNLTVYEEKVAHAWDLIYSKPYCRIGPHIIGILLAYHLHDNGSQKVQLKWWVQSLGWCVTAISSLAVIYGPYLTHIDNQIVFNFYNALSRSCFAISVAWVVYTCLVGYGGPVNYILSLKLWIPLGRLTYCAYLFHPLIMDWYFESRKNPFYFSHKNMVLIFFDFLLISYGIGFIISAIFEAPIIKFEKLLKKN